jgi:hypothetical protein
MDKLTQLFSSIINQQKLVDKLKREMDILYDDYDKKWTNAKVQPSRDVEVELEAIAWAKETEWNQANHELSLMNIRYNNMKLKINHDEILKKLAEDKQVNEYK